MSNSLLIMSTSESVSHECSISPACFLLPFDMPCALMIFVESRRWCVSNSYWGKQAFGLVSLAQSWAVLNVRGSYRCRSFHMPRVSWFCPASCLWALLGGTPPPKNNHQKTKKNNSLIWAVIQLLQWSCDPVVTLRPCGGRTVWCGRKVRCRGSVLCSSDHISVFPWAPLRDRGLRRPLSQGNSSLHPLAQLPLWLQTPSHHSACAPAAEPPRKEPSSAEMAVKTKEPLSFIYTEAILSISQTQSHLIKSCQIYVMMYSFTLRITSSRLS